MMILMMRRWVWVWTLLVLAEGGGKGRKNKNPKPSRAVLDRLSSTTLSGPFKLTAQTVPGLLPPPLDVAPYCKVEASATCGETGDEDFCREMPGKRGIVCGICEGPEGASAKQHPATHATDGDSDTWWQSPTLAKGDEYKHVDFVVSLPDEMELLHVIIKTGPSSRPLAWSLEVSTSDAGEDWRLMKAFGDKEHCRKIWDLRPERRRRKVRFTRGVKKREEKPACSTQFASPRPLENGEMHIGLGEGVWARRVRISFRAPHPGPVERQLYTIRAVTLAARCRCHGHADSCNVDAEGAQCACGHGTCGPHCERCCSGAEWAPHETCSPGPARAEDCFSDSNGLLCVNCTDNRAGPLCDKCLPGFYTPVPGGPCLPCNCDIDTSDGTCTFDRKLHQVVCACRDGAAGSCNPCVGSDCDVTTTRQCACDPRGVADPDNMCDADMNCVCKAHVIGDHCDACSPGHFGLSAGVAGGCRPCYCSGLTDHCEVDPAPADMLELPLGDDVWNVTDDLGDETLPPSLDDQGRLLLISYEVEESDERYWVTDSVRGEQLWWYGGELRGALHWSVVRGDAGGTPTTQPDLVIVAADGTKIGHGYRQYKVAGQFDLVVPLVEEQWYFLTGNSSDRSQYLTRHQFMDVLRDVRAIMLRAHFHTDQDEIRLDSVRIWGGGSGARERCLCPVGYRGPHCTHCDPHYLQVPRAPHSSPAVECVPCPCNGHASCETLEGPCGPCAGNTTGPHCERCLPGHYGNPVMGPCKPCACPLYAPSNNFSPNCALSSAEGDEFVCTQCPDGYAGDRCEICDAGYWGSPTVLGGSCKKCECGGAPCHPLHGGCLQCPPHTEGAACDQCEEGYWFGGEGWVSERGCMSCECGEGALAAGCSSSGQCACRPGWTGLKCDTCDTGHAVAEAGCPVCKCGRGAVSESCDPLSGLCECRGGASPPSCDSCEPGHYNLSSDGCEGCNCSSIGSESNVCDIRSGQCRCKAHVTGRACDTCEEGYWGLQLGGCRRCSCGAGSAACDPYTGACACAPGVGGDHCDTCLSGFYNYGPQGCLQCPVCSEGRVCEAGTGRCVCPAGARGARCEVCIPGYYGRGPHCKPCKCGPGALNGVCDATSGKCQCRRGWAGRSCADCAEGYYGPRCRPCSCHKPGTLQCQGGICPCDLLGRCTCKINVIGDKCESCADGTFGLSEDNPDGCTACFCFGRTSKCTQAGLARGKLHAHKHTHVTLQVGDIEPEIDENSLLAIHTNSTDVTLSVPHPPVPVYVSLEPLFLGDHVTSYGGGLSFTVEEEGGAELPQETRAKFPLVRIYGRDNIVLDYYERVGSVNGTYTARFHESLWRWGSGTGAGGGLARVSRGALMVALQHLTVVLVRVSTRTPTFYDNVHSLLLNVSMDTAIPGNSRSSPALGVELCSCPAEYASDSCQGPAIGFYIPQQRSRVDSVAGTIVISVEGEVRPCRCNGRADKCHPVTGQCLECRGGTGGPSCEVCAEGHFGTPGVGRGCEPCPCPERTRNFADSCELYGDTLRCLCKPGYAGEECEECSSGYVRSPDGGCEPCDCHPLGAVSGLCDHQGRCQCRPFATGIKCDQCVARRTTLGPEGCQICDNCTQTLLDSIETLSGYFKSKIDLNELSRIPAPYPALQQFALNTSNLRNQFYLLTNDIHSNRDYQPEVEILADKVETLKLASDELRDQSAQRDKAAYYLSLESMKALEDVLGERKKIGELVGELDDFARGERHVTAHKALKEAKHLLRTIKNIGVIDSLAGASDAFDSAAFQSTSVQEYAYRIEDIDQRLKKMQKALEIWRNKADDVIHLIDKVWDAGDVVNALTKSAKPRIVAVRDIGLRCRLMLEDINTLTPLNFENDTVAAINRIEELSVKFPELTEELQKLTAAAEEKEGILYELTPKYRAKYLKAVQKHVEELEEKSKIYKSLFAGSRNAAASGVAAARAWTDVKELVRAAGREVELAEGTADVVKGLQGGNLTSAALAAKELSRAQIQKGKDLINQTQELGAMVDRVERASARVRVEVRGVGWGERGLGGVQPRARSGDALRTATTHADRLYHTNRALYDEASEIRRRIRYQLRRKLTELQKDGDTALGAAQEYVSQIRGNTVRAEEMAGALAAAAAARARDHTAVDSALRPATDALRHLLHRARHAADTIAVSVTSGGAGGAAGAGCARAYQLSSSAVAVTRLSFTISFEELVKDGPVVYLGDQNGYIQILVEGSKLKAVWNLGDGEAEIVHQQRLAPAHDDTDRTTFRVELERVWGTIRLTVELASGSHSITATNSSLGPHVSLRPQRLWLGSPHRQQGLPGCVHSLYYDDKRIGLWNFVHQEKEAQCAGCSQRYWRPFQSGEASLAWFNGEGYSEIRRSTGRPYDRRHFSVSFTFRSRDHDTLLLMVLDKAQNRSVSVWLRGCRVVLSVRYGGEARLELAARGRHCTGRPTHVQAIRLFHNHLEKGSLRVNGEETLGSPSQPVSSAALLPDLSTATYWVGGLPPGERPPPPDAVPRGLLGCLGALTVDGQGYDPLDTPTRHGVEPNCGVRTLRTATLEGDGYIELPSPLLRRKAALGISFRSRSPDGLILYRAPAQTGREDDDGTHHYITVQLLHGEVQVRMAAGKSELQLDSNGTKFDDGTLHTLRLVRAHKKVELWLDERRVSWGELPGTAVPARDDGLYLGGVPGERATPHLAGGFSGTLADLILDGVVIGLETAVTWHSAHLGRAHSDPDSRTSPAPETLLAHPAHPAHPPLCAKAESFTVVGGAVKVGDAGDSVVVARRSPGAALALSLMFRTHRTHGLLILVPGSKAKPRHYLALMLREGQLRLVVRGRKRKEITLTAPVADGAWRSVSIRVANNRMVLASGGVASTAKVRKAGLGARVYIGGFPDKKVIPHIPDSVVRVGGLIGCIRRVVVAGRELDLVRDSHRGLRQCFPNVEPAAYFTGESWALWNSSWSVGESDEAGELDGTAGELRVVMRTRHAGGVLLATSHLLLELNNGLVTVSRVGPSGVETATGEWTVCDGRWHEVVLRQWAGGVSLAIDGARVTHTLARLGHHVTPLYIAAAPENIAESFGGNKESFKGCIREVVVAGVNKDWTQMETLHNVLLDSCPVPQ